MTDLVSPASWAQAAGSGESLWAGGLCGHGQQSGSTGTGGQAGSGLAAALPSWPAARPLQVGVGSVGLGALGGSMSLLTHQEWPSCPRGVCNRSKE